MSTDGFFIRFAGRDTATNTGTIRNARFTASRCTCGTTGTTGTGSNQSLDSFLVARVGIHGPTATTPPHMGVGGTRSHSLATGGPSHRSRRRCRHGDLAHGAQFPGLVPFQYLGASTLHSMAPELPAAANPARFATSTDDEGS